MKIWTAEIVYCPFLVIKIKTAPVRGSLIIARVGLDVRKYVINRGGDDMRLRLYYFYGHFGKPATDYNF